MYWVASLCASTERAKARLWKHQYIDYGYEIPDNCMALLLGLTFCVVSPLIAPVALLYFLVNSIIGKYTLIYVYAERFQSGGKVSRYSAASCVHALQGLLHLRLMTTIWHCFVIPALTLR